VVHAAAGLMERQARVDGRPPTPVRWSAADTTSALQLTVGILAALYRREQTGEGDRLEVAMIDAVLSADDFAAFDLWDPDPSAPRPVIAEIDDRGGDVAPLINSPQRFAEAGSGIRGVVPYRGEHNREVLGEWLELGATEVDALEVAGTLAAPDVQS